MPQLSPYITYKTDDRDHPYLEVALRGFPMLRMSALNKGTAFTREERAAFSLEGLLPPRVTTLDDQVRRIYQGYMRLEDDIQVHDPEPYAQYTEQEQEIITQYGGRYLVRGGSVTPLSGNWQPERGVIIAFDTMEQLRSCFSSPEYRATA